MNRIIRPWVTLVVSSLVLFIPQIVVSSTLPTQQKCINSLLHGNFTGKRYYPHMGSWGANNLLLGPAVKEALEKHGAVAAQSHADTDFYVSLWVETNSARTSRLNPPDINQQYKLAYLTITLSCNVRTFMATDEKRDIMVTARPDVEITLETWVGEKEDYISIIKKLIPFIETAISKK